MKSVTNKKPYFSYFKNNKPLFLKTKKSKTLISTTKWLASWLLFVTLSPSTCFADESAIQLLNRMNQALHQLSYKGTLVLVQGNNVSSLLIDHTVVNGVQSERVVRLNEAGSEMSREVKGFSLSKIPRIRPEMEKVYSFDLGRENRVANIPCRIITARPKDRQRYLQKYCIDMVSGMLLDYRLVGKTHKPVEQFMFTNIEIRMPESGATNMTVSQGSTLTPMEKTIDSSESEVETLFRQISNTSLEDGWVVEALPAGFEIRQAPHMKEVVSGQNDKTTTKHYVLSDGLMSVSLFFTPISDNAKPMGGVKVNSGALNVVTQDKNGHRITAVGEAPELTLKNIVKNLKRKP